MSGGEISGNAMTGTSGNGAGVGFEARGGYIIAGTTRTFEMTGGVIQNNSAKNGGGVCSANGVFILSGGASIAGNTASNYGGGVFITGSGADAYTSMNGGEIKGNNAATFGGGVFINQGTFTMTGGTIYGSGAASGIKNTSPYGAALGNTQGTAKYGDGSDISLSLYGGTFYYTNDTLTGHN